MYAFAMPTIPAGWLDQHERFPPLGPKPPQEQPQQPVSWAKAPTRTSQDAKLVAQGKSLKQEVSTRRPSRSDRSTRPDDGSHRLVECRPATPTSMFFGRTQYWRGTSIKTRRIGGVNGPLTPRGQKTVLTLRSEDVIGAEVLKDGVNDYIPGWGQAKT